MVGLSPAESNLPGIVFCIVLSWTVTAAIFPPSDHAEPDLITTPDSADAVSESRNQGAGNGGTLLPQHTPALYPELVRTELAHGVHDG